jgi:hypothetical protein
MYGLCVYSFHNVVAMVLTRNSIASVDHPDLDDPQKETPPYAVISTRSSLR